MLWLALIFLVISCKSDFDVVKNRDGLWFTQFIQIRLLLNQIYQLQYAKSTKPNFYLWDENEARCSRQIQNNTVPSIKELSYLE